MFTMSVFGISNNTYALSGDTSWANGRSILGMRPWYYGLAKADGTIDPPTESELPTYIAQIALNVVNDAMAIAGILVTGFIIYGGYLYMFSEGDAGKVAKGKNAIKMATIGAIIVLSANIIFNTISVILLSGSSSTETITIDGKTLSLPGVNSANLIKSMVEWAIALGGLVSVAFVVYGGVSYMTAAGDAGKLAKAKSAIKYALIGLLIVGLSTVMTNFIFDAIIEAQKV